MLEQPLCFSHQTIRAITQITVHFSGSTAKFVRRASYLVAHHCAPAFSSLRIKDKHQPCANADSTKNCNSFSHDQTVSLFINAFETTVIAVSFSRDHFLTFW